MTCTYNIKHNIVTMMAKKEKEQISDTDVKRRLQKVLRGRAVVEGMTLDSLNTRRMDDGFNLKRIRDGWILAFSVADVAAMVDKGDELDRIVKSAAWRNSRYIFPDNFSIGACSLVEGELRPAVTFTMQFAEDFELIDYDIERTAFRSLKKYSRETMEQEVPPRVLADWYEFIIGISERRKGQLQGALTRNFNKSAGALGASFEYKSGCFEEHGCTDMVAEMTMLTSRVAAKYMCENNLPAFYRISGDLRTEVLNDSNTDPNLKKWMDDILVDLTESVDIAHMLSVDVTTPIRRYDNLIMQRVLAAHVSGEKLPYTVRELEDLKKFCRWVQKNPRSVQLDFNKIVREPDPIDNASEFVRESDGEEQQRLHNLVQKAGLNLRSVGGRVHMQGFSFCVEGLALYRGDGEEQIRTVSASQDSDDAKNGAAAGMLEKIRTLMPDVYQRHFS